MSPPVPRGGPRARCADAPRAALVEHLMQHAAGCANDALFASLLCGWALGRGCLPADLGLGSGAFERRLQVHFPRLRWARPAGEDLAFARLRARALEIDDLVRLLAAYADREVEGSLEMAVVVAHGCLGDDHLWQDLGLASRAELGELMQRNFPRLAARNDRDMKWKKFLYRQLCEMEGLVICRSPSCEVCCDHALCFGPEH